jgi:hypothetical protein
MACSKYESVGPEIHYVIQSTENGVSDDNGKMSVTGCTIEHLTINGHEIELVNSTTHTGKSFFVDTKNYGPIKMVTHESGNWNKFTITMLLTREQKEQIKELH